MIRFLIVLVISVLTVSMGSVAWPKLTAKPPPEPLGKIREFTLQTPLGERFENILGLSDDLNVASVASSAVDILGAGVKSKTQDILCTALCKP